MYDKPSKFRKLLGGYFFYFHKKSISFLHGFSLSLGELLFLEVMRRYALACVLCFNSEHFFVNNLTALFYNSIIFFTLVVTVYEGRCWPINKYFDLVSCSADERAADGMEAMLTRKGESVELGECKRWFWNNSPFFWIFSLGIIKIFLETAFTVTICVTCLPL